MKIGHRFYMLIFLYQFLPGGCVNESDKISIEKIDKINNLEANRMELAGGCYTMILNRDTSRLFLESNGGYLSGTLQVVPYEKDKSAGTVKGKINGTLLMGWYNFQSEGINSISEIVFKISGNKLYKGFGPIEQRGDSVFFKEVNKLKFEESQVYYKTTCK